ncbi:single-stranded DNA-binding protein [Pedobacter sp. KLB.chiD]|uniref:single-stranded DNA-binding protein n=1 Tax=Pedobacter sp. KLB.chiD TaxID=3387402 RepID=UPI00399BD07F
MNIIGRLTRDAEVRNVAEDKQVVNFSVAINESYKNKAGERVEQTTFFDCAYWLSPKVAKFLTKGTLVELTGRVFARAWAGRDGQPQAALNFTTSQIKFHGGGKKTTTNAVQDSAKHNTSAGLVASYSEGDDDLPF